MRNNNDDDFKSFLEWVFDTWGARVGQEVLCWILQNGAVLEREGGRKNVMSTALNLAAARGDEGVFGALTDLLLTQDDSLFYLALEAAAICGHDGVVRTLTDRMPYKVDSSGKFFNLALEHAQTIITSHDVLCARLFDYKVGAAARAVVLACDPRLRT